MVSGALSNISRLCPRMFFLMQIRVIFALPSPLRCPLGALGSFSSRVPLYPPLSIN